MSVLSFIDSRLSRYTAGGRLHEDHEGAKHTKNTNEFFS
jgi:hypothetical protein